MKHFDILLRTGRDLDCEQVKMFLNDMFHTETVLGGEDIDMEIVDVDEVPEKS